jgi:hypothetical protein
MDAVWGGNVTGCAAVGVDVDEGFLFDVAEGEDIERIWKSELLEYQDWLPGIRSRGWRFV